MNNGGRTLPSCVGAWSRCIFSHHFAPSLLLHPETDIFRRAAGPGSPTRPCLWLLPSRTFASTSQTGGVLPPCPGRAPELSCPIVGNCPCSDVSLHLTSTILRLAQRPCSSFIVVQLERGRALGAVTNMRGIYPAPLPLLPGFKLKLNAEGSRPFECGGPLTARHGASQKQRDVGGDCTRLPAWLAASFLSELLFVPRIDPPCCQANANAYAPLHPTGIQPPSSLRHPRYVGSPGCFPGTEDTEVGTRHCIFG